jgi:hypothetical protein
LVSKPWRGQLVRAAFPGGGYAAKDAENYSLPIVRRLAVGGSMGLEHVALLPAERPTHAARNATACAFFSRGTFMQEHSSIRKFFAGVFTLITCCFLIAIIATFFGYTDLHAGKLAIAGFVTGVIAERLSGFTR